QQRQPQENVTDHPLPSFERGHCLFCKSPFLIGPGQMLRETCLECHSPLQSIDMPEAEITLRRIATRIEQSFDIAYYTYWPQSPRSGVAKNLSPTGVAIVGADHFFIGQLIKLESEMLRAVAQVKNRESIGESATPEKVGLKFVTVSFNLSRGTFVAVTV